MDATIIHEYGSPRIAGTRITVYDIVHYLEDGDWHYTEIAEVLRLTPEHVLAAIKYIDEHKEEVMAVHRQIEDRMARGNPPEFQATLDAAHAQFLARFKKDPRTDNDGVNGARHPGRH